jgi:zinc transport system ATP-binding protein
MNRKRESCKETHMNEKVIDISNLSFSYDGEDILEDIQLSVAAGEFIAVLGPNGGGKTTLLKLILGLLRPQQGEVRVFGKTPAPAAGKVGYVPQHTEVKAGFPVTAEQVVLMGLSGAGGHGIGFTRQQKDSARSALERVGVLDCARRRMDRISGGQRQRVLVARALVGEPELLLFDEPTSNIDPHGRLCFFELLADLRRSATLVVVSHDLSIATSQLTGVACVNKRLLYNPESRITEEMLSLIYGSHEHSCPLGAYIHDVSEFMRQGQGAE